MKRIFFILSQFCKVLPIEWYAKASNHNVIFPFYHIVCDEAPGHIKHLYRTKSAADFESDLDFLLKHFEPITFDEYLNRERFDKPAMVLSFDDGLREFADVAAPILLRKGVPAINFLNSDFIDNKELFYRYKASLLVEHLKCDKNTAKQILSTGYKDRFSLDEMAKDAGLDYRSYLNSEQPYLTTSQIEHLASQGFQFGAHSLSHPLYESISEDEQIEQTLKCVDSLSSIQGTCKLFSFPFTDNGVKSSFFDSVYKQGVEYTFGTAGIKDDEQQRNIQRIPMEQDQYSAQSILYGEYCYCLLRQLIRRNVVHH